MPTFDALQSRFRDYIRDNIKQQYANPNGRGYNYQQCADDLNAYFDMGIFEARHIQNFFRDDYDYCGNYALWVMLGLLQIHKVPYTDIFPAVNTGDFLDDDGYFQTYHGIMYPRNSGLNTVESLRYFELTIARGEQLDPPSATLRYKNKVDENREPESRIFHGTPVLSKGDIVSILFHDDDLNVGTFFHFYFSYNRVNAANLKFKRGFVVTSLSNEGVRGIPVVLNFIMRNWLPIDSDTLQSYPGLETLLQHSSSSMCVPAEKFYAILANHDDVSDIFEPDNRHDRIAAVERKDLCVINESEILANIKNHVSSREGRMNAYRCFLELKKASLSPTHATWEAQYDDLFKTITGLQ